MLLKKWGCATLLAGMVVGNAVAQAPVSDIGQSRSYGTSSGSGAMDAAIYQQLQQLRQEVMELRGTVEEQENQLRQLKQQSLDRYINIDRRLSAIGKAGGAAVTTDDSSLNADADSEEGGATTSAPALASTSTSSANPGSGNASSDYARAYSLVGAREYQKAIEAFTGYVQQYPQETYTPNAWYWLGELYVAVDPQNLQAATEAFQKLLSEYPENRKIPAAMYKLATVYYLQGDKQRSQEMLTHVIDRYGNTGNSAVMKSREFLRKNF